MHDLVKDMEIPLWTAGGVLGMNLLLPTAFIAIPPVTVTMIMMLELAVKDKK